MATKASQAVLTLLCVSLKLALPERIFETRSSIRLYNCLSAETDRSIFGTGKFLRIVGLYSRIFPFFFRFVRHHCSEMSEFSQPSKNSKDRIMFSLGERKKMSALPASPFLSSA